MRSILVVLGIVLAANAALLPLSDRMTGLSIDLLFWLRQAAFGARHDPAASPAVVVAIDEETYRTPPFRRLPDVMWTGQIAKVVNALIAADARVLAFDVIFSTSVEQKLPGYDRPLLIALRRASRDGRVVLGKVQHQVKPISPFAGYSYAVGHQRNIRPLNVLEDQDGVIRRVPLFFRSTDLRRGERHEASMALEVAARMAGVAPERRSGGGAALGGRDIPARDGGLLVNFDGAPGWIPTYSLADIFACAEKGDRDFFRRHFAGKAVFFGAVLDLGDRRLTSRRFINNPEGAGAAPRCTLPPMKGMHRAGLVRDTIPGVYIHASAVDSLLRGDTLHEFGRETHAAMAAGVTLLAAVPAFLLSAMTATLAVIALCALWAAAATGAFAAGTVLPLLQPIAAALLSLAAILAYRFVVADKDKRYLRHAFSFYLPDAVVDRLVRSASPPALGGETRELTVFFSDIAGFTGIAEGRDPEAVVTLLNDYLSVMTDAIEAHGGFVDKYIGDAVVAVFGAPMDDPDHAAHAVEAALDCQRRLAASPGDPPLGTRIGINTGEMLVGNIGSHRRFNYTVMGDAVNLAARLEGANKVYGSRILVSETTRALCGPAVAFREIDRVRVVGRAAPVSVFEPLDAAAPSGAAARFERALAAWRAGRFPDARADFAALADEGDPVAARFVERIDAQSGPPPEGWTGVTDLDSK